MPQRLYKDDWEGFLSHGRVPPQIREDVLQSWHRSSQQRIARLKRAPMLNEEQLLTQRAVSRRLRTAAQAALDRAGRLLDETGNIMLLCDRNGIVVDAAGDRKTLNRGHENHLYPGGNWSEAAIGTNAIGTALHLGRSVVIREAEHFCEEIQRWNCAAVPILGPGLGETLGVVDISWQDGVDHRNGHALAAAMALQIESEMQRMLSREREILMEKLHLRRFRRGNEPMLVMDRSGADVFATDDFAQFCEDDVALSELRLRVASLVDQRPEAIAQAVSECLHGTNLEVISNDGEAIGVLISLRCQRRKTETRGADLSKIGRAGAEIARVCETAQRLAKTAIPVLIEGETGTGKTHLARAIHQASPLRDAPFRLIDCAELTDADLRDKIADGGQNNHGVLCLKSPGATPADLQKLLLRFVEQVADQGGRLIALSTRHLYSAMTENQFRSDLYYRIAGARLAIPPLRERPDEIAPLLRSLVARHSQKQGQRDLQFTSGAMTRLKAYAWPGNLREMQNLIATLDALSLTGLIDEATLPDEYKAPAEPANDDTLRDAERTQIMAALMAEDGNMTRVARRLGIARSTLYLKLDSYGIDRNR